MFPSKFLFITLTKLTLAYCNNIYSISTLNEFTHFSKTVNSGVSFEGTTVFLEADMDFTEESSESFEPIGKDERDNFYFRGTFDGQGYIISNLALNSTSKYTGLFGYSNGITIKNTVIDDSCTFESSSSDDFIYVGGIIGECYTSKGMCNVESVINMADISFNGITSGVLYFGGISGYFYSSEYHGAKIRNCANYGTITHLHATSFIEEMGGIVGRTYGESSATRVYITNCLSYGDLVHSGTVKLTIYIGGIAGTSSSFVTIGNCIVAGNITTKRESINIGSVIGCSYSASTIITYCYWSKDILYPTHGYGVVTLIDSYAFDRNTFEPCETININNYTGNSLVEALNTISGYYNLIDFSYWIINKENKDVSFTVNNRINPIKLNYQLIILPNFAVEGDLLFSGWYTNKELTVPQTNYTINEPTELYGKWGKSTDTYTISFETRLGTRIEPISAKLGTVIQIPRNTTRENCELMLWADKYGDYITWNYTVTAHNITFYSMWLCTHITTAKDLVDFAHFTDIESSGNFFGTTIFLDNDIIFDEDLSDNFEPIGKDYYSYFHGIFDGQGYLISNFVINAPFKYMGLFGYSDGIQIKNVIIDDSCSITNTFDSGVDNVFIGGIIGYCSAYIGNCIIENVVNMASITFTEKNGYNIFYMGGIAGQVTIASNEYVATLKNSANYNSLSIYGTNGNEGLIGGIVGCSFGYSPEKKIHIFNCINHGAIFVNTSKTTHTFYLEDFFAIGGIVGRSVYNIIENCVNVNEITSSSISNSIGSIVGEIHEQSITIITHCYWTNKTDFNYLYGYKHFGSILEITESYDFDSFDFQLSKEVSVNHYVGNSLIEALNSFVDRYNVYNNVSHWILNLGENDVLTTVNNVQNHLNLNYPLILLPNIGNSDILHFDGWFTNIDCTEKLINYVVNSSIVLYGKYKENKNYYTITFDTRGRALTPDPITAQYLSNVNLKDITADKTSDDDCVFRGWSNEFFEIVSYNFTIPMGNITLYAMWLCTNITTAEDFITFSRSVNNGGVWTNKTVYLGNDIDFTGLSYAFEPIGNYEEEDDTDFFFKGTFDGQGYVVRGLKVSSDKIGIGLFGYSSQGITIQNVVVDKSCKFIGTQIDNEDAGIAGIIGYCISGNTSCIVKNSINMADISFSGKNSRDINIGGISGYCKTQVGGCAIENCINYGTISYDGDNDRKINIGGIAGQLYSYRNHHICIVMNTLNYGSVAYRSQKNYYVSIGGIVGYSMRNNIIMNCVKAGLFDLSSNCDQCSGMVVGNSYKSIISYCYWNTQGSNYSNDVYKDNTDSEVSNVSGFNNNLILLNRTFGTSSLLEALNNFVYASNGLDYSNWISNPRNASVSFSITHRKSPFITVDLKLILLPNLARHNNVVFKGWYMNENCSTFYNASEVTNNITLFGYLQEIHVHTKKDDRVKEVSLIVLLSVLTTSLLVAVVFTIGKHFFKKLKRDSEIIELIEPLIDDEGEEYGNEAISSLYPEGYAKVGMKRALINAGFKEDIATDIMLLCYDKAEAIQEKNKDFPKNITIDDIASVVLYTTELSGVENNPYRVINSALMDGTPEKLEPIRDILCLVMNALRKFPIIHGKPLYRGIRCDVLENDTGDQNYFDKDIIEYREGEEVVWKGITSTSQDISVTKAFLAKKSKTGKIEGTIFIIEDGWGYDVHSCSVFPEEKEVVLEPGRHFTIKSNFPGEGFTIINIELLKTPLLLPEVLGTVKINKTSRLFSTVKKFFTKKFTKEPNKRNYRYD